MIEEKISISSGYEGRQDYVRTLETPKIEVFKNIYSDKSYKIRLVFPEFTAICPKTGLPDFGTIYLLYEPEEYCLELKSLKEYFFFYRNVGIFHENATNKILEDLVKSCQPRWMKIKIVYNVRGGITTTCFANYKK
ncbi:MAG: preQ(1) synthase [Leptonema sp. (in: bacteria)]